MKLSEDEKVFLLMAITEETQKHTNVLENLRSEKGGLSIRSSQDLENGVKAAFFAELSFLLAQKIIKSQKRTDSNKAVLKELEKNICTVRKIISTLEFCGQFNWYSKAECN